MTDATDGDARGAHTDFGVGDGDESIERLWTPYRMRYLVDSPPVPEGSTAFLEIPKLADEDGLIVARGEHCYVVLNLFPYNPGHCMVVPYRQVAELEDLTDDEAFELIKLTQKTIRVISGSRGPRRSTWASTWGARAAVRSPSTCISTSCPGGPAMRTTSRCSRALR